MHWSEWFKELKVEALRNSAGRTRDDKQILKATRNDSHNNLDNAYNPCMQNFTLFVAVFQ